MTGIDGDCGELGVHLPRLLTARKLKPPKHCEDQTKSAYGSHEATGPPFCDLRRMKTRGQGQRPQEDPRVRVRQAGSQEQASVFWKPSVFEERVMDCPKPPKRKKPCGEQPVPFPPGWAPPCRETQV